MSSQTWQYVEELFAISPWIVFIVAVAWFRVLELRDNTPTSRAYEQARPGQSDSGSTARRAGVSDSR